MKSLLWFGILAIFTATAQAENFYTPLLCSPEETYLQVKNSSSDPQPFWFQALGTTPFIEAFVEVKAHGNLSLSLQEYSAHNESALAIKTQNDSLSFKAFCKTNQLTWNIENTPSPWKKISVSPQVSHLKVSMVNLSQQKNVLEINIESFWGILHSQTVTLPESFTASSVDLTLPFGTKTVTLRGQGRWIGKVLTSQNQEVSLQEDTVILSSIPTKRYFLFESQNHHGHDSFIVPLENPKLIAESLEQIAHPERARLLVARIEKSQTFLNRDMSSTMKSPWSWQVLEAQNYADFAHISCDGTPALVEERLNSWLMETGGTICFWSYRVVRELSPPEITQATAKP